MLCLVDLSFLVWKPSSPIFCLGNCLTVSEHFQVALRYYYSMQKPGTPSMQEVCSCPSLNANGLGNSQEVGTGPELLIAASSSSVDKALECVRICLTNSITIICTRKRMPTGISYSERTQYSSGSSHSIHFCREGLVIC